MQAPVIGISIDNKNNEASSGTYESAIAYSRVIMNAGGIPLLLPHEPQLAGVYVEICDGLVLTGGADPHTEAFGQPTHPQAHPIDQRRQSFDLALLAAADLVPHKPVLGVCLGMQLMALHKGGRLNQYLPQTLESAKIHMNNRNHGLTLVVEKSALFSGTTGGHGQCMVVSHHRQAVEDPGGLRIVAVAPDGVIEATDDPTRPFYIGVQWHPERAGVLDDPNTTHRQTSPDVNLGLYQRLVHVALQTTSSRA